MTSLYSLFRAIVYPFQGAHVVSALLLPGGLVWLALAMVAGLGGVACLFFYDASLHPLQGVLGLLVLAALFPLAFVAVSLLLVTFVGYLWRMVAVAQRTAFTGTPPHWGHGEWKLSFVTGLHGLGYLGVLLLVLLLINQVLGVLTGYEAHAEMLETPVVGDFNLVTYSNPEAIYPQLYTSFVWALGLTVLFGMLATPFALAPFYYNAHQPNALLMLQNLLPSWRWALQRYVPVCAVSLFWQVGLLGIIGLLSVVFSVTVVGILLVPFLMLGGVLLTGNLYVWAFSTPPCMGSDHV